MITSRRKFPERMKKIRFLLPSDEWHGFNVEDLWVEEVSEGKYRIENSPFFAKMVSFEDIVSATKKDNTLLFESVLLSGGHSTYRIILGQGIEDEIFLKFWKPIESLGCTFESADFGYEMFTVDVPPHVNIDDAYALFEEGENAGAWGFEEGHLGHVS